MGQNILEAYVEETKSPKKKNNGVVNKSPSMNFFTRNKTEKLFALNIYPTNKICCSDLFSFGQHRLHYNEPFL